MPGPILNPKCEAIPLSFRIGGREFWATPQTLADQIHAYTLTVEPWSLWTGYGQEERMALFDCERMIHYDPGHARPWQAGDVSAWQYGSKFLSWRGAAVILGPGWESYVDDIYWAVARAMRKLLLENKHETEKDLMVQMALEGMMRSHGRI